MTSAKDCERVGIAVVEYQACYLVGERPAQATLAGLAEFPGGRCLPGESFAVCAERECYEETGLMVYARRQLHRCIHRYEHGTCELEFWLCELHPQSVGVAPRAPFTWIPASALTERPFPAANQAVLQLLLSQRPRPLGIDSAVSPGV
ncbi:MAG: mutator protein [Planctomycetaceae bacterium]|nr:MAG: mutator protein [Planctomycetaceae bacterium]